MKKTILFVVIFVLSMFARPLIAQDSVVEFPENYKRNTIKWNLTPFLIWSSRNINLSYERILKPYRSFSVNVGYFELPSTGIYDSLNISRESRKGGFTVSGDYRYYFKNRNKRIAPDGLFWGIYGSYHHYQTRSTINVIDSDVLTGDLMLEGRLNIISAGVELGYQFAIKKHWTIDLVFLGPSLTAYNTHLGLETNLDADLESDYLQAVYDILVASYPGAKELIQTGTLDEGGFNTSIGFGLRYLIQVGYRF